MSRGCLNESLIAAGVISWNVTRRSFDAGTLMTSAMCQAMASPSRSRSVASQTWAAALASLRRRRTCFSESSGTTYSGRNVLRSTPIFDFGRSRIWPNDASTLYSLPSIRSSVLAFVGDSTTTRSCLPSANANPFAGNKKGPSGPPTRYFTCTGNRLYLDIERFGLAGSSRRPETSHFSASFRQSRSSRSSRRRRSTTSLTSSERAFEVTRMASGVSTRTNSSTPTKATSLPGAQA